MKPSSGSNLTGLLYTIGNALKSENVNKIS